MDEIKNIAVLGGDKRYEEVINLLQKEGLNVYSVYQKNETFNGTINDIPFEKLDAVLLPILGVESDGKITNEISKELEGEDIYLKSEYIEKTSANCIFFVGNINEYLRNILKGKKVVKLFERDDIAIFNSIPTAEGAIMLSIQNTNITIHNSKVLVIGFGRIGDTLCSKFMALGAKVYVAARKSRILARVYEKCYEPVEIKNLCEAVKDVDICINTVPKMILTEDILKNMKSNVFILDLSSSPYGTDFEAAKKLQINAITSPGLPSKVASKTAGEIIGRTMFRIINDKE